MANFNNLTNKQIILEIYGIETSGDCRPDKLTTPNIIFEAKRKFNRDVSRQEVHQHLGSYRQRVSHIINPNADLAAKRLLEACSGEILVAQAILSKCNSIKDKE